MSIKNGNNLRAFTFQRVHGCANVNSTRTWVGFFAFNAYMGASF